MYTNLTSHSFNFYIILLVAGAFCLFQKDKLATHDKEAAVFFLAGILALSLLLRVDKMIAFEGAQLDPDAIAYRAIALNSTGFYGSGFREPLFVFLIKIYTGLFGTEFVVLRSLTVVLSLICIILIYVVGKKLFKSELVGLLSAFFTGVNSYLVFMSVRSLRLELFMITILLFFYTLFLYRKRNYKRYVSMGIIGGLVCLTRITSLSFVIPLVIFVFWQDKISAVKMIIPILLISIMVTPHFINNKKQFGNYTHSIDIHARWYRNQEFRDRPGFASSQELGKNSYIGPPVTSLDYIFGMHSLATVVKSSTKGFIEIFRESHRKIIFSNNDLLKFCLMGGYVMVLFTNYRFLWALMLLLIGPTFFLAGTIDLDSRLVAHIYPFMIFITTYFMVVLSKTVFQIVRSCAPANSFLKKMTNIITNGELTDVRENCSHCELMSENRQSGSSTKPTILYVIGSLALGGAEKQMALLIRHLCSLNYTCHLFVLEPIGSLYDYLKRNDVTFYNGGYISEKPWRTKFFSLIRAQIRLIKAINKFRPDIVHAYLPLTSFMGSLAGRIAGVPLIITAKRGLGYHQERNRGWRIFDIASFQLSHVVTVNSKAVLEDTIKRDKGYTSKIRLIYNGLNPADFAGRDGRKRIIRNQLNVDPEKSIIITVANLIPYKGHTDLLKAAAIVDRQFSSIIFLLVGEDRGIQKGLEQQVQELGIGDCIFFLGQRSDIADLMTASDISVLASHEEGFSNVILESMAAGLPVVATQVGGNPEAILDGETGWLVPPENPEELAKKIIDLLNDPGKAKKWGKAGRRRVEQNFTLQKMVSEHLKLYNLQRVQRSGVRDLVV